jgi:hypothetical protein
MPRRKPKVDEFIVNLRLIENIMKKHTKIGIYALPGEGKSTLVFKLREKYLDTDWHFYEMGERPVEEPYVWAFISDEQTTPEFDIIYCLSYSRDFKESKTGVTFHGDDWRPFRDYYQVALRRRQNKISKKLRGKTVKTMKDLQKLLNS